MAVNAGTARSEIDAGGSDALDATQGVFDGADAGSAAHAVDGEVDAGLGVSHALGMAGAEDICKG
jgi:hypothetical protein